MSAIRARMAPTVASCKLFHSLQEVASVPATRPKQVLQAFNQETYMRIRAASLAAAAMTVALLAAGCGTDKGSPSADTPSAQAAGGELVIWADDKRAAALKPFADKFGTEN